jgi:hypothetical protein
MVLEYAAGGELFDLIAGREKVSSKLILTLCILISSPKMKPEKYSNKLSPV